MTYLLLNLLLGASAEASTLFLVDQFGDLNAVDLSTHQGTLVGPVGVPFEQGSLSWDASTSTLWMLSGHGDQGVYTINILTGAATLVGYHGLVDAFASAAGNGALYALQGDANAGLWSLDAATGTPTFIGTPVLPFHNGYVGVGGADFDGAGNIIANASYSPHLYAIDPTTAVATYLGSAAIGVGENGLAVDIDTGMIYLTDTNLGRVYEVNPAAGYAASLIYAGNGPVAAAVMPDQATNLIASTSGFCPGPVSLQVLGATANRNVALAYSRSGVGASTIPGGPCQGTGLPLNNPRLGAVTRANGAGEVRLPTQLAAGACVLQWVAIDLTTCEVSNVAQM